MIFKISIVAFICAISAAFLCHETVSASPFNHTLLIAPQSPVTLSVRRLTALELRKFASRYTGPLAPLKGIWPNYKSHLMLPEHGFSFSQVGPLTYSECQKIHGGCHNGYLDVANIYKW